MMLAALYDNDPDRTTTNGRPRLTAQMARRAFAAILPHRPDALMTDAVNYLLENPAHDPEIEHINEEAFGPGRFARAAYKIREGGPHERSLSFVALHDAKVIASVRMTRIAAGEGRGLLLGPLAVRPAFKNLGIGRKLVRLAVEAAQDAGSCAVFLVGDGPYYGPLGFKHVPRGQLSMSRPVDFNRLLVMELKAGSLEHFTGEIVHANQVADIAQAGG